MTRRAFEIAALITIAILAVSALPAAEQTKYGSPAAVGETAMASSEPQTITVMDFSKLIERKTATINITSSGLELNPSVPGPGPVRFTVNNNSGVTRGIVITGRDWAKTPIIRYSQKIAPGQSATVHFWLYPEERFQFRDWTGRQIVAGKSRWASTLSTSLLAPLAPTRTIAVVPRTSAPGGAGAGPSMGTPQPAEQVRHIEVAIEDRTLTLRPSSISPGRAHFMIRNTTKVPRAFGIEVSGKTYETRLLGPGEKDTLEVDLKPGSYSVFTVVRGTRTLNEKLLVK